MESTQNHVLGAKNEIAFKINKATFEWLFCLYEVSDVKSISALSARL